MSSAALSELKIKLGSQLIDPERVTPQPGLPTQHSELDRFLLWGGLPCGRITLFQGRPGSGLTSLWLDAACDVLKRGRWAVFVETPGRRLNPWSFLKKTPNLSHLLVVQAPSETEKLLWVLHELIGLSLFDLIGCDLNQTTLKTRHLAQLQKQCQHTQTALVLQSSREGLISSPQYALVLHFSQQHILVKRALHRTTPQLIPRRHTYAHLMPQPQPAITQLTGQLVAP